MKKSVLFLILFVVTCAGPNLAQAVQNIKTFPSNYWQLDLGARYFSSNGNYSKSGGTYSSLPDGFGFSTTDIDAGFRAVMPTKNWALFGETRMSSVEAKSRANTKTNSGLNYMLFGTDYVLYKSSIALIPEFSFLYPFTKNETSQSSAPIGEGAMEVAARMIAQINSGIMRYAAWLGYTYRDQGRSALAPYGVAIDLRAGSWTFGADLKGYTSVSNDVDSNNDTLRQQWATRNSGTSFRYYSANPNLLESNVWAGVQSSKELGFLLGAGSTLNGSNAGSGYTINLALNWRFLAEPKEFSRPTRPQREKSELDRFQEQTLDGVDQNIFENNKDDEQYEETIVNKPKPAPRRAQPNKNTSAPRDNSRDNRDGYRGNPRNDVPAQESVDIQDELDKTEMQIEVKRNRRTSP